ncbi:MAG TPA: HAMP domain-containing sensor histidine kinase [Gemmatimonadaceae bacterium]
MTRQSIFHWFAPPELAHPDLRQRARALWIVSWPFFVVVAVLLSVAVLVEPYTAARRAATIGVVGLFMAVLHAISRAGRPVLASWMLVTGLSLIVTQRAWMSGGIHAPVAVFYVLFIIMAGALLGARGGFATAEVCILGALALGCGLGWVTSRPNAGSVFSGFVFTVLAIGLALVVQILVRLEGRDEGLDVDSVHMVVGDMRSPMQVLLTRLEVLRAEVSAENAADVEAAIGGVNALRRMTNSLLDVSRLKAQRMPIRRSLTDLSMLAHSVACAFRDAQPTCEITVETRGDASCNCDAELTRRIIERHVSNAVKVTPIGGCVRVVLSCRHALASIAVSDDGPTIPAEQRREIFEPYRPERLWNATGDESSGLGLAFCCLAVEAQGGTIRIENRAPRGNVYVVEMMRSGVGG